jgi:hypothetical protein
MTMNPIQSKKAGGLNLRQRNRRRLAAVFWALAGYPGYILCFSEHAILHGHGGHPPYPTWTLVSDVVWITAFAVAGVLAFRSNMRCRVAFCVLLGFLPVSRLVLRSDGGPLTFCGELPVMIAIGGIGILALFSGQPPPDGICVSCGDDLTGNVSGPCPEGGTTIENRPRKP